MSNNKTEALYLADVIENDPTSSAHHYAAVAWMRRQYAEIQRLSDVVSKVNSRCDHLGIRLGEVIAERNALAEANEAFGKRQVWWDNKMLALEAERDALLEALKQAVARQGFTNDELISARAAIARTKGGGNG